MKKIIRRIILLIISVIGMTSVFSLKSSANSMMEFHMISDPAIMKDSITVSWKSPEYLKLLDYEIDGFTITDHWGKIIYHGAAEVTTANIKTGLGYADAWTLSCDLSRDGKTANFLETTHVNSRPLTIAKKNLLSTSSGAKQTTIEVAKPPQASGVELKVFKGNACIYDRSQPSLTRFIVPLKSGSIYRYQARAYYTNLSTRRTYYGDWSPIRQFINISASGKATSKKKGFSIKLKKISGVTQYKIYVSKNNKTGFRLSKTVKVGSKASYNVAITKFVTKRRRNYIRVIPYIKGYGNSDIIYNGSVYVYK